MILRPGTHYSQYPSTPVIPSALSIPDTLKVDGTPGIPKCLHHFRENSEMLWKRCYVRFAWYFQRYLRSKTKPNIVIDQLPNLKKKTKKKKKFWRLWELQKKNYKKTDGEKTIDGDLLKQLPFTCMYWGWELPWHKSNSMFGV